ncbi:DMT family transporter [Alkalihalobacillus sp. FSL R5-0424]
MKEIGKQGLLIHYLLVMVATLLWGVNIVCLKILVTSFTPVTMTAFRIGTAGLVLFIALVFIRKAKKLSRLEWGYVIAGGGLGVFAHHLFLAFGLQSVQASTAVLLLGLVPVATAICSIIFLKESFTKWTFLGIGLAFLGVLFVQGGIGQFGTGSVYILIAVLVQAVSFLFIRKASETMNPLQVTTFTLLIGAIVLFICSFTLEPSGIERFATGSPALYAIFFFSAICSTAAGQLLFNASISRIGASKSAIFLNFVPFFGVVCSAIFLNESIVWYQWCGFVLIVAGVLFGTGYIEQLKYTTKKGRQAKSRSSLS